MAGPTSLVAQNDQNAGQHYLALNTSIILLADSLGNCDKNLYKGYTAPHSRHYTT